MLGLSVEAVSGIIGGGAGILGAVISNVQAMRIQEMKMRVEESKMLRANLMASTSASISTFEAKTKNAFSNMTRRIVVLMILSLAIAVAILPAFMNTEVAIPVERTTGGSFLFGLIDTTNTETHWETVKAIVSYEWMSEVVIMIVSFYTTASTLKR